MKTIGMIGGMSWESSSEYYRIINEEVKMRLGGRNSAKSLMYSVNFEEIASLQLEDEWDKLREMMLEASDRLKGGGADFIVICTNTMHKFAEDIEKHAGLPLLHISDAAGQSIKEVGMSKVGLLGTRFTMEQDFYKDRLRKKFGIETIIPEVKDRELIQRVIYEELVLGVIKEESRREFIRIIGWLVKMGAEGIILGCTEIPLLVKQQDVGVRLFDTTRIHAETAVEYALMRE